MLCLADSNKSLTKILTENALEYLAFGKGFIMDRLTDSNFWSSEDIVRARFQYAESRQKITYGVNLNENLKNNL